MDYDEWKTTNIVEWVQNDEYMYNIMLSKQPFTKESAYELCVELFGEETPDDVLIDIDEDIDWEEIAADFNES